MAAREFLWFYNSNPSTLSLLLGTVTCKIVCPPSCLLRPLRQCWIICYGVTNFSLIIQFPVAVLTVSVVSDSVFHKYSLKISSRLPVTASALMYIFRCYDWYPLYLLPSISSYCHILCFAKLDP
ncbi:uncharacterized protein LOC117210480 [Bombus bifarius]|uniref:Uncharacterized protein LOC117210480 n=1 Tax=Bombus bifarius TaxID=103933 RepID=A0A6P8M741_9HYME|nr:uncharacterized protein LOC117210480 [Bombus bifarius]